MDKPRFYEGQRVRLRANPEEGWPEELATVDGHEEDFPGVYVVTVDHEFRTGPHDDGLREVGEDQMEEIK